MDTDVPYMPSVKNLHSILDSIQNAGIPDVFNLDFLKDLGYTSSNDRPVIKVLKYLGMLDTSGRPQTPYREFVDHNKAKVVLAERLHAAYDDLYLSDKNAHSRTVDDLKGWFKTKTGAGNSVAEKIARTFKYLADYADFSSVSTKAPKEAKSPPKQARPPEASAPPPPSAHGPAFSAPTASGQQHAVPPLLNASNGVGFVYRLEIHLPDTQNVDTFRAIFKALREELMQ